jgi:hypothetical protein
MRIGDKVVIREYSNFLYLASLRSVDSPKSATVRFLNGDNAGYEREVKLDSILPYDQAKYEAWLALHEESKRLEAQTKVARDDYSAMARTNPLGEDLEWLGRRYGKV